MLRRLDWLVAALLLAALMIAAVRMAPPRVALSGEARVIDGDTIELGGRRLRLAGLDAPELSQICERDGTPYGCGDVARDKLKALSEPGLQCSVSGQDRYGRGLAACAAAGQDVGQILVRAGLAVSYGRYEADERLAAALRVGLWAGHFDRPSDWRKAHAH